MPEDTISAKVTMKVGSRKSQLALVQTRYVISEIKKIFPEHQFEVVEMSTLGDNVLDKALSKIGEKSLFTKELEVALEKGDVDFVVHSMKDLPTTLPPGMVIGAVLEREDPRDAVIIKSSSTSKCLDDLPNGSVIGTSSLRRAAQLKVAYPNLEFQDVRGNLNTRIRKLDDPTGPYSALILAVAGVARLGWSDRISQYLEGDLCMHAVGQGALAVECRDEDMETLAMLANLHHRDTVLATIAERSFMKTLEGGCSVPVGVNTKVLDNGVSLHGGVWSIDGQTSLKAKKIVNFVNDDDLDGEPSPPKRCKSKVNFAAVFAELLPHSELIAAEKCGRYLATELIGRGADKILKEAKEANEVK
eukprot:GFUD01041719.1.p1 GENE.GFUD01041719.1~~GFUD01041719.1.p1  ORF type:complete len:360 (+),score=98.51 GFUD01041719.1:65-1144(+)